MKRAKDKPQQKGSFEIESKKRWADQMDVELESETLKKARMVVGGEVDKYEEKENITRSEIVNVGLHGQPGGSK